MNYYHLNKLYWGVFFILINFKINQVDIFPDIIGYILFAIAFSNLSNESEYLKDAGKYNGGLIVLWIFSLLYNLSGLNTNILINLLIVIAFFVFILIVFYNMFLGIQYMMDNVDQPDLAQEAYDRWRQFLALQIAALFSFILMFVPGIGFIYILGIFIVSIILCFAIMGFIKRCEDALMDY